MIYHEGNRTIFPEDKCWDCQASINCNKLFLLESLIQSLSETVQFNITECDGFTEYELKEDNDE